MRKQLTTVIDKIVTTAADTTTVEPEIIDDYKKLNDKCDDVITKIRNRKEKSAKPNEVK